VSNTFADGNSRARVAFSPPQTAIQEFKMQTSTYDASIGHTIGSVVNVSTRSGTNVLHGEAHWFVRNRAFDAPNFFNNKANTESPVYQDNRYGASAGAPVYLPGLYNGKNKTFWFYAYEANKWIVPANFTGTVPTAHWRISTRCRISPGQSTEGTTISTGRSDRWRIITFTWRESIMRSATSSAYSAGCITTSGKKTRTTTSTTESTGSS
jgi:hypothetical protein